MTNGIAKGIDSGFVTEKIDRKPKPSRRKGVSHIEWGMWCVR